MKSNIDHDPKKFDVDQYGNLIPKNQEVQSPITYKGFTIDVCIGHVKLWDENGNFVNVFTTKTDAKKHVDTI